MAQEHRSKTLGFEKIIEEYKRYMKIPKSQNIQNHSKSETGRNLQNLHLSVISPLVGILQQEVLENQRCQMSKGIEFINVKIVVSTG